MKAFVQLILVFLFLKTSAQNYQLDSTFGNNGKFIISSSYAPVDVLYENDKYLLINHNGVISVNYNGTIDTSFGNQGTLTFNDQNSNETYYVKGAKLINGYVYVFGQKIITGNTNKDGFIIKITPSGNYDLSFGTNGKSIFDFGGNDETINDLNINSSNQIYVVGSRGYKIFLSRIEFSGSIDTTFDSNGFKTYPLNDFENSRGINLFLQSNEIVVVGSSTYPTNVANSTKYLILLKVDENGILSSSFGVNGIKEVVLGTNTVCGYPVIKSFLKDNNELYFERFESCSFATQGNSLFKYNISENSLTYLNPLAYNNVKFEMESDNKIFTTGAGRCTNPPCNRSYGISKKNSDGTPDLSFNTTGTYSYRFGPVSDDYSSTFYIHDDGKILLAGYTVNNGNVGVPTTPGLGLIRITNSPLNTEEFDESKMFKIYPNPTNSNFYIDNSLEKRIDKVEIMDCKGRQVDFIFDEISNSINVESLQSGIYFVKITYENKTSVNKLIKG